MRKENDHSASTSDFKKVNGRGKTGARKSFFLGFSLLLIACLAFSQTHWFRESVLSGPAYRAERLFNIDSPSYAPEILKLAQRIEWGDSLGSRDVIWLGSRINDRHREDITLLFHAVASGNLSAIDALLGAGANPFMPDRSAGSDRNFVYVLTLPGGSLMDMDGVNRMIGFYLNHGGDPNGTFGDVTRNQGNLADGLALIKNNTGLRMVLERGADPWKPTYNNGKVYSFATRTLASTNNFEMMHELIDRGYFTARSQTELEHFFASLSNYAQRGDERSLDILKVAERVLKRNPYYTAPSGSIMGTHRIFKEHWSDELPGVIPWGKILSDRVD